MVKWLRKTKSGMVIISIIRILLGFIWLQAGVGKITSGGFSAQSMVVGAIKQPVLGPTGSPVYGWYTNFLKGIVQPNMGLFNFSVQYGELLIGLGLILGALTTAAAFFGVALNFTYLLAGSVSMNPMFLLGEFLILIAGLNAGKIGLDHWIIPNLRKHWPWLKRTVD